MSHISFSHDWILRTGAPWCDFPPDYGGWSNAHRCFIQWVIRGFGKSSLNS
ncbi:MAG: transposase [Candidatus Competibacteraceae bacterium]|nr:MAG: transposase [Candidatus Competibacteraceae bacterium]